jgi:hypothetical protein
MFVEASMKLPIAGTVFLLSLSVFGCSSSPPPPNSFTNVYDTTIGPTCTNAFCHYAGIGLRQGSLDMNSRVIAYWNLVDQPCQGFACASQGTRVVPGRPDASILYMKVSQTQPTCGVQMPASVDAIKVPGGNPAFSGTALTADQQDLIKSWILDGAQND